MKLLQSGVVRVAGGVTALVVLWGLGNKVNLNLAQLPVEQAAEVSTPPGGAAVKPLFPVAVQASPKEARSLEGMDPSMVEAAFGSRASEIPVEPPPNFAEMARGTIRIDGVSTGGVFVGGRFYKVGSMVSAGPTDVEGQGPTPRLVAARSDRVVFDVGGSALVMTKDDGGWH